MIHALSILSAQDQIGPFPFSFTLRQKARYALHTHHLIGPKHSENADFQFQLVNNVVEDALKWALVIHGSHYGLIKGNTAIYNADNDYYLQNCNTIGVINNIGGTYLAAGGSNIIKTGNDFE